MRHIREIQDIDGRIYREVLSSREETSWDQAGEFLDKMNQGIGQSLSPVSFKGGFSISTSWLLFILMFVAPKDAQSIVAITWFFSLFINFR